MPDAGVVFGSMLVPDMCQVPEPSYDRQTTTTTKPTDDDEWVLIVNYKSSACSACGVLLSAWMMSAQLWRIITRFSGGVKCLPHPSILLSSLLHECWRDCSTCLTFKLRVGLCFSSTSVWRVGGKRELCLWSVVAALEIESFLGLWALPTFGACGIKCQIYGA